MRSASGRLPPLNALRAFEASARHLNFRLAAEELGVTQGAVAQHVRGLEADLKIRLFDRLPRSLALTAPGRGYAAQLRHAFELIGEATATLRPELDRLTISTTPTFASKWLIPRLGSFTRTCPDVELRILATESLSNFGSHGVDIAVRQGQPPFGSDLLAELLFEQDMVAVCGPTLLPRFPAGLQPKDLDHVTLLDDAHDLWPEFIESVLNQKPSPKAKYVRFNQTALAVDAAATGQGIAIASRFLVEDDIKCGRLVQVFAQAMRGKSDLYVVTPRKPRRSLSTKQVQNWLLSHRTIVP